MAVIVDVSISPPRVPLAPLAPLTPLSPPPHPAETLVLRPPGGVEGIPHPEHAALPVLVLHDRALLLLVPALQHRLRRQAQGFQRADHPPRGHHHPHQLLLVRQLHPCRDAHHGPARLLGLSAGVCQDVQLRRLEEHLQQHLHRLRCRLHHHPPGHPALLDHALHRVLPAGSLPRLLRILLLQLHDGGAAVAAHLLGLPHHPHGPEVHNWKGGGG
ncbi:hypothetical protein Nmel_004983 [Mimus melanotis]